MTGFLPPAALRNRIGDLAALAATANEGAHVPIARHRDREYRALVEAVDAQTPCIDDDRFIADRPSELTSEDIAAMSSLCSQCDVRRLCRAYADAARVEIGFWAGRQYPATTGAETICPI